MVALYDVKHIGPTRNRLAAVCKHTTIIFFATHRTMNVIPQKQSCWYEYKYSYSYLYEELCHLEQRKARYQKKTAHHDDRDTVCLEHEEGGDDRGGRPALHRGGRFAHDQRGGVLQHPDGGVSPLLLRRGAAAVPRRAGFVGRRLQWEPREGHRVWSRRRGGFRLRRWKASDGPSFTPLTNPRAIGPP